jgi:hypothetical protein
MNSTGLQRLVPLFAWIAVTATFFLVVMQILSYGFIPAGDARRHAAKVMTDKEYNQIVVLRPEYQIDHSPGWDWILRRFDGWVLRPQHQSTDWEVDKLMGFSVAVTMLCVYLAGLPWLRRPEAWMAVLLAQLVALPEMMLRLDQGRPFLVSEGALICVLFAWGREGEEKPSPLILVLTTVALTLSVWLHGAWYLWVFVLGAFFMAGAWRKTLWLGGCWVAGVVAGALLSGKPVAFLYGAVFMAARVFQEHAPKWMLVGEFQPSEGEFETLALLAVVYLWRRWQGKDMGNLLRQPLFWMIAVFWTLGFQGDRFWADWGMPAVTVWLALQLDDWMVKKWPAESGRRLLLCALIAAPFFLDSTSDLKGRFTRGLTEPYVDASKTDLKGWMPEGDGIFYSADMAFFYDTFYHNPTGNWRYILGFEPALMPDEDLKILRTMQWNHWNWPTYDPWVEKMRPQDRLEIPSSMQPPIPELEWHSAATGIWIGRKPAAAN